MGFYERRIFPRLMNAAMASRSMLAVRQDALRSTRGRVLEIGFGTGLNLRAYPAAVTELVGLDANVGMEPIARRRIASAHVPASLVYSAGGRLPFDDRSFDAVVTTWTLCSVGDPAALLADVGRVLGPGGAFHFVEHGLSPDPRVQRWQRRLNPIHRAVACGCNLDRDVRALVAGVFEIDALKEFQFPKAPRFVGWFYQGVARPREPR